MRLPKYVYYGYLGTFKQPRKPSKYLWATERIPTKGRKLRHIAGNAYYLRFRAPKDSWVIVFSSKSRATEWASEGIER